MGVAGSGKSTFGRALACALGWAFVEGDDYHPRANVEKMARGEALDDTDREPWLQRLHRRIAELDASGTGAVVACSALKASYRTVLAGGLEDVRFVYLCGSVELIARRLRDRHGHFMPSDLLDSQIAALEPPEEAIFVPIDLSTDEQVRRVLQVLGKP